MNDDDGVLAVPCPRVSDRTESDYVAVNHVFVMNYAPLQYNETLVGTCVSGCGCEVRRRVFRGDPDSDLIWCRRCQAYGLFRWRPV